MAARSHRAPRARVPAVPGLTLLLAVLLLGAGQGQAAAGTSWAAHGTGSAGGVGTTVQRGVKPTITKSTALGTPRLFTIQWSTSHLVGTSGKAATAYIIRRTGGAGGAMTDTTCDDATVDGRPGVYEPASPTATTHTCTDTVPSTFLSTSTYTWTVEPVFGRWVGQASEGTTGTA